MCWGAQLLIDSLAELLSLSVTELALCYLAVFAAGLVRGFAGFGLSAVLMASIVTFIPPVSLIPVCFLLEATASFVMFRGGAAQADMRIVWGLAIGSALGAPLGLYATNSLDPDISKTVALAILLTLSLAQLMRLRPRFLATNAGLYSSGLLAGVATGLASIGGMVVALYVLASDADARRMRASLVMFLFLGMFSSVIYLYLYEMLNLQAVWRALALAPAMLLGLAVGTLLFRPRWLPVYKSSCLLFLVSLCALGLYRQLN